MQQSLKKIWKIQMGLLGMVGVLANVSVACGKKSSHHPAPEKQTEEEMGDEEEAQGNSEGEFHNDPNGNPNAPAGTGGSSKGNPATVTLPGLMEPLSLWVQSYGFTHIKAYPTQWEGTGEVFSMMSAYGTRLNEETCGKVQDALGVGEDDSTRATRVASAAKWVRQSTISVKLYSIPFLPTQLFKRALMDKLNEQNLRVSHVDITNPLVLENHQVKLKLEDDAWTKIIGQEKELENKLQRLFASTTHLTGESSGEISAIDLACDLAFGRAQIELTLNGQVVPLQGEATAYQGTSFITVVDNR